MYNIYDYISERRKVISVTIDGVMNSIRGTFHVDVLPNAHKSISKIEVEPFYIGTNFKKISSNLNSRFILISAPGATGKSAFGKYIAYKRAALYWNLAELSIGDGTFQGTLYKALGISKISSYAKKLHLGEATLVIDAFDEAEIISGRHNVETFLYEANDFLESSTVPSIVLLSRTETAQNIAVFFKANNIPYTHYEIDYFPLNKAKEFVLQSIQKKKKVTQATTICIDDYFDQIGRQITDTGTKNRFIGYAPVLEAIAAHISETNNTAKLLSDLNENSNESMLIERIMKNLLDREQEKFLSAFKERIGNDIDKIGHYDKIYSADEQLVRVLNYILMGETNYGDYLVNDIPDFLVDEYKETIAMFLPQHPFIQNSFEEAQNTLIDFAGPAFRDFSLASIILSENHETSAELYYQRESANSHFPSQLFWDHYVSFCAGRIKSQHFLYLLQAYKSKATFQCQTYLDVSQDIDGTYATFRIDNRGETIDATSLEVEIGPNGFVFDNISNTSIDVDSCVVIGQGSNTSIADSTIDCTQLIINATTLTINSYASCVTSIISRDSVVLPHHAPINITTNIQGELRVDIPNIYDLPKLSRYKYCAHSSNDLNIYVFIHYLRKIFNSFRTHKKDMPARDAEKIDFVVIAGIKSKQDIFQYLIEKKIIFRSAHLYKIDLNNMSKYGISWGALISSNVTQLQKVYDDFCAWDI